MGRANDQLENIAKGILQNEPELNWADAYDLAATANPELYAQAVSEPTDMAKARFGTNPMMREEARKQQDGVEAQLKKSQMSDEAEELDFLARNRSAETGEDYYTAYENVAKSHPELYEKAVNGGVTEAANGYLKMLQQHEEILTRLEAEGSAVDQGAKERARDDVLSIRSAMSSGVFDSEPKVMEAMLKVTDLLFKVESVSMTGSELNTELSKLADELSDATYLELDAIVEDRGGEYETVLAKTKDELRKSMTEGQIERNKLVQWLESKAVMAKLVA